MGNFRVTIIAAIIATLVMVAASVFRVPEGGYVALLLVLLLFGLVEFHLRLSLEKSEKNFLNRFKAEEARYKKLSDRMTYTCVCFPGMKAPPGFIYTAEVQLVVSYSSDSMVYLAPAPMEKMGEKWNVVDNSRTIRLLSLTDERSNAMLGAPAWSHIVGSPDAVVFLGEVYKVQLPEAVA